MTNAALPHDWYDAPLPKNVRLSEGAWLYSSFAFIHCASHQETAVRIGEHSGVYNGSFFNLGPEGSVAIGRYTTTVGCIFSTNGRVRIGDYVFIAHEVVIADSACALPDRVTPDRVPDVVIEDDAWLGFRSVLLPGARIGRGAIVGCAAVVDFEVPDYAIVAGNPARVVGWAKPEERVGG